MSEYYASYSRLKKKLDKLLQHFMKWNCGSKSCCPCRFVVLINVPMLRVFKFGSLT